MLTGAELLPGGITRGWMQDMAHYPGKDSPEYVARVDGEFPDSDMAHPFVRPWEHVSAKATVDGPRRKGARYVTGADLGKHEDPTWVITVDVSTGVCVKAETWLKLPWPETVDRVIAHNEQYLSDLWIDATGVGDPVYDYLVERGMNLPRRVPDIPGMMAIPEPWELSRTKRNAKRGQMYGYKFSEESKRRLVLGLVIALENGAVGLPGHAGEWEQWPDDNARELMRQLVIFESQQLPSGRTRYQHPAGDHDDAVMALALASMARDNFQVLKSPELTTEAGLRRDEISRERKRGGRAVAENVFARGSDRRAEWW